MDIKYKELFSRKFDYKTNKNLTDILYEGMKDAILDGTFPIGGRINEKMISEELEISRTPIRNAIQLLIEEKLVVPVRNRSVIVKGITEEAISEYYQIKLELKLLLYETAMTNIKPKDVMRCSKLFKKIKLLEKDYEELKRLMTAFKIEIFKIANTPTLKIMLNDLEKFMVEFDCPTFPSVERVHNALDELMIIFEILKVNDDKRLQIAVTNHIYNEMHETIKKYRMHINMIESERAKSKGVKISGDVNEKHQCINTKCVLKNQANVLTKY